MSDTIADTIASIGHFLGQSLRISPSSSHLPKMLQGERHPLDFRGLPQWMFLLVL